MTKQYFRIFSLFFIAGCIFLAYDAKAQKSEKSGPMQPTDQSHSISEAKQPFIIPYRGGRRVSIKSELPSAVEVVNAGDFNLVQQTFNAKNVTEAIQYIPGVNVAVNRSSTINLRGLGTRKDFLVLIDGRRATYAQSQIVDINSIPIAAIEQIEVIKDGGAAVYGSDAVSGVVNIILKEDLEQKFDNGVYQTTYQVPRIVDYSGFKNDYQSSWSAEVKGIFSTGETSFTNPDNTYGIGGSIKSVTTRNDDFFIQQTRYYDPNNYLRQMIDKEYYPEGYMSEENTRYDCSGNTTFSSNDFTDQYGYSWSLNNSVYATGKVSFGYRDLYPGLSSSFRQSYDPTIEDYALNVGQSFLELSKTEEHKKAMEEFYGHSFKPDFSSCPTKKETNNVFTVGPSFRLEDFGGTRETFLGGNATYTHFFNENLGATGDVGFNFKSDNNWKINVFTAFAGVTYVPFDEKAGLDDKFTLSAHVLGGLNSVTNKNGSNSNTNGNFALKFGLAGDIMFSQKFGLRLGFDNIMVPQKNNTTNNFLLTGALRIDF